MSSLKKYRKKDFNMNKEYNEVKKFHEAFGHPHSNTPQPITLERAKKRYAWMLEEINEFLIASENQDIVIPVWV